MKFKKLFAFTLISMLFIYGCSEKKVNNSPIPSSSTDTDKKVKSLNKAEVIELLIKAKQLDQTFNPGKPSSKNELYEYYAQYFTSNYVDKITLGNLKQENGKWIIAYPESELNNATYFNINFNERTEIEQSDGKVTLTNYVEDGLYPAHKEIIYLIYSNNTWKLDNLEWK